MHGDIA
jgi:ATP-dependent RNA helicase DDX21